jgi:hypothetical protein
MSGMKRPFPDNDSENASEADAVYAATTKKKHVTTSDSLNFTLAAPLDASNPISNLKTHRDELQGIAEASPFGSLSTPSSGELLDIPSPTQASTSIANSPEGGGNQQDVETCFGMVSSTL